MKRIKMLSVLFIGILVGFLCGAVITVAVGDMPPFDGEQAVGQAGETKISRARLAQLAIFYEGDRLLNNDLRNYAIVEEAARVKNLVVTADDVKKRVEEDYLFADANRRQMLDVLPRWVTDDQTREVLLLEKLLNLTVGPDEVQDFFASQPKLFMKPARVQLILINTTDKAEADSALRQLKDKQDANKVAAQRCSDPKLREIKGEIGWRNRSQMSMQLVDAIFAGNDGAPLKAGQFTDIIPNNTVDENGNPTTDYSIFYVKDYQSSQAPRLEEVKPAATYFTRVTKLGRLSSEWFKKQAGTVEWKRVKDLNDPQAPLVKVPIDPREYDRPTQD